MWLMAASMITSATGRWREGGEPASIKKQKQVRTSTLLAKYEDWQMITHLGGTETTTAVVGDSIIRTSYKTAIWDGLIEDCAALSN